ncbi:MAG: acyltransferase [Betaproteobacteria bacterium]
MAGKDESAMSPTFSVYLDLVRFMAALAVFVHHLASSPFTKGSVWWPLRPYGAIAVTIFFVLSGYVIAYVSATRERTAQRYASARIARLYSVVLIALLLTAVFDFIGISLNPEFYHFHKVLWKPESWSGYIASLFLVNEYQVFDFDGIAPGSNSAFWSMSFEATYYLIAGLMLFSRRVIAIAFSLLILLLAGRTIAAMLPIWALGYALYFTHDRIHFRTIPALGIAVISALFLLVLPHVSHHLPDGNFGISFPWGRGPFERELLVDYLAAIAISAHLVSVRRLDAPLMKLLDHASTVVRWLGSLTFPLYCIHVPAICLLAAISPWSHASMTHLFFISVVTALLVIAITPLCEAVKKLLRATMMQGVQQARHASGPVL